MYYLMVLMSSGWYAKEIEHPRYHTDETTEHIDNGDTVAFCDDLEYFAENMKIDVSSIKRVD